MKRTFVHIVCTLAALVSFALSASQASAVTLDANGHRNMPMGSANNGRNDFIGVYSYHSDRQENNLISFDVSAYYGATATGDGTMTFTVENGAGIVDPGAVFDLELRQLNAFNAAIDMSDASSYFIDGSNTTGTVAWKDNAGVDIVDLGYTNSVLDITSGLIGVQTGPFGGDTNSTSPTVGTQIVFTVPQATLQAWFDQSAPSIVVIDIHQNPGRSDYYFFGDGDPQPLPFVTFETAVPEPSSLALAGLGLLGLVGWGLRRRQG